MSKHGWTTLLLLCKAEKLISCLVTPDAQASKQENTIYFVLSCLTRTLVYIIFFNVTDRVSLPSSGNMYFQRNSIVLLQILSRSAYRSSCEQWRNSVQCSPEFRQQNNCIINKQGTQFYHLIFPVSCVKEVCPPPACCHPRRHRRY